MTEAPSSGLPSRSALLVAGCRHLAADHTGAELLCSDPFARLFVDDEALDAARANNQLQRVVWLRTRYIDDAVVTFTERHRDAQVLLLGAGLDMRAFRMSLPCSFFEVDTASTLAFKDGVLEMAGIDSTGRRATVPLELGVDRLGPALCAAGFDPHRATIVIWEGVVNYLDNDACEATLLEIGQIVPPDSLVLADYVESAWYSDDFVAATRPLARALGDGGERLQSGLTNVKRSLSAAGFEMIDDEAVELLASRYAMPVRPRFYPSRIFTARRVES